METATKKTTKKGGYIEAIGRRKTATARVRITPAAKTTIMVNDAELQNYFKTSELIKIVQDPFVKGKIAEKFEITAKVIGGGANGQAEAVRHGITRALTEFDEELRGTLKKLGFLKRDPRAKERRKFGLKKARKAPQWSKR
ncbi:30S ribosomal protein S9 [Candidatus Nomurabacteria bacterium]|jgi:small subunit ribosomal protein S9|nr:30S ribosomal protein S9 [Candidatus Nomurabacteria bacterium]